MRTRRRANIEDLRLAIDCLPRRTKLAMLEGITGNEIIVGAYSTGDGVCPMLAAHRAGGRTNLISFAKAWDRFAFRDSRSQRARRATERELLILRAHLEASLLAEDAPLGPAPAGTGELAAARAEHEALVARRRRERDPVRAGRLAGEAKRARRSEPRPGDPSRARELRSRRGWAWTRIVRRYDDYERVLERLQTERAATEERDERAASEQRDGREPTLSR
jgi:hypothetical protein